MGKAFLVLILVLFSINLKADANAQLQMRLAGQTKFQQRIAYILMQQAFVVLTEPSNTVNHANRLVFAIKVRDNVNNVIQSGYVIALVGRPNLVAFTTTCDDKGEIPTFECTTNAGDPDILSQISTDWNLWAGQ